MSNVVYFRDGPAPELWREASGLAARYNWPDQARLLARGVIPEGFAREVGKAIVLFLARPIISYAWAGLWSRKREEEYNQKMRSHGCALARLRVLLAMLRSRPLPGPTEEQTHEV